MDNIIEFPERNVDDEFLHIEDENGDRWMLFTVDYVFDDTTYSYEIWARDFDEAERRIEAIGQTSTVFGRVVDEFEV